MAKDAPYDANPANADSNITPEEIEAILAAEGRGFVKDTRAVLHFVRRTGRTIESYTRQIRRMHADIQEQARSQASSKGQATTLNPLDALRFLPPERVEQVFDGYMRERLNAVTRVQNEAEIERRALTTRIQAVTFAVESILEDSSLDQALRDRLSHLLRHARGQATAPGPGAIDPGAISGPAPGPSTDGGDSLGELFS